MSNEQNNAGNGWKDLCQVADLPANGGHYVECEKRILAVFKINGEVRVIDDTCPHAGASLASGWVEGDCVTCPWHGWSFHTKSGEMPENPNIKVKPYESRIVDDKVQIKLEA